MLVSPMATPVLTALAPETAPSKAPLDDHVRAAASLMRLGTSISAGDRIVSLDLGTCQSDDSITVGLCLCGLCDLTQAYHGTIQLHASQAVSELLLR